MWLAFVLGFAVLLALVGGVVVGGIFALILVPIAVIIAAGALLASMWARATSGRPSPEDERSRSSGPAYPHGTHQNASSNPATPDQIVDAQQKAQ